WLEGFESQREVWETQYAEAQQRFEQHQAQVIRSREAEADVTAASAKDGESAPSAANDGWYLSEDINNSRTLATDEAIAALREKSSGGQS
ncbi:30S ribosomal protein S1, partial [Streptomyces sp. NPDC006446]